MKLLILCLFSIAAFGQAPSPISNTHILVYPAYGKLAEIKPEIQFAIPFTKKEEYKEIVFHRTQYDTAAEYELLVTLKKKGVVTPPPVIVETRIDDDNTSITYSGSWIRASKGPGATTATAWYNAPWTDAFLGDNLILTNSLNAYAEFSFTGNKIEVIGEKRDNHGLIKITMDGVDKGNFDTYEATKENKPSVLYSADLPQGAHKIRVTFTSYDATKVPSRNTIVLDGFKVYSVK